MVTDYLDVTEEWVEKVHEFKLSPQDISSISDRVMKRPGKTITPGYDLAKRQ